MSVAWCLRHCPHSAHFRFVLFFIKMKPVPPIRRAIKYSALCLWVSALSACHGKASNFPPFPESAIWITFTKTTPPQNPLTVVVSDGNWAQAVKTNTRIASAAFYDGHYYSRWPNLSRSKQTRCKVYAPYGTTYAECQNFET